MKYVVLQNFYDRFNGMALNRIGEEHEPPNEDRAAQLVKQGFIEPVEGEEGLDDRLKSLGGGYYELPNGEKVRGKDKALESLRLLDDNRDESKDTDSPGADAE